MDAAEAKALADVWLSAWRGVPCAVFDWSARETRTHWRFYWNTVAAMEGREPALKGLDPVAVEKRQGVVLLHPARSSAAHAPANEAFPSPAPRRRVTEEEAKRIAQAWIDATMEPPCSIVTTFALPYGWAFTWTTDANIRSNDVRDALGGNGPLVVLEESGALYPLGTEHPVEETCALFAREVLGQR